MKLLITGLGLIGVGLALILFTDLNPAMLFIGGVVCTFLGIINGIRVRPDNGLPVSADPTGDAAALSNLGNYGSTAGDANAIFSDSGQP